MLRSGLLVVGLACVAIVGCNSADANQAGARFPELPDRYRQLAESATGFQKEVLADGVVDRVEIDEGNARVVDCLSDRGYNAEVNGLGISVDLGKVDVSEAEEAAMDEAVMSCQEEYVMTIQLVYDIQTNGTPEEQRQVLLECLKGVGVLEADATMDDLTVYFEELRDVYETPDEVGRCIVGR